MFALDFNSLGPVAGIITSIFWTATSILFSLAGRRIGPTVVNASRLALAIVLLALIYRFLNETSTTWWPAINSKQMWLLGLSGVIGLAIGDQCLFTAFVDIGPRLSNLLMTTAPVFAAMLGLVFLDERLSVIAWTGMAITLGGIGWVILERPRSAPTAPSPHRVRGFILALAGGFCQAAGLLLSKAGMGHGWMPDEAHLDPQAATFVRMTFAGLAMVPLIILMRWRRSKRTGAVPRLRLGTRRAGYIYAALGTIVGPVLGVWMSLVAVDATSVGIAQTLLSLTPIFILPYAAFVEREHVSWRAVGGAVIAVIGIALLFREA